MAEEEQRYPGEVFPIQSQAARVASTPVSGVPLSSNPLYDALENFEREARQKKFMIAECEDSIANLKKELQEVSIANKNLETECEKMELEVNALQAKYEKLQKDKIIIESKYDALSKEMNEVMNTVTRKKVQLKEILLAREEKLQLIAETYRQHIEMYRRNPIIAQLLDKREANRKKERELDESAKELEKREQNLSELQKQCSHQWPKFLLKCITIAEKRAELIKLLKIRDELRMKVCDKKAHKSMTKNYATAGFSQGKMLGSAVPVNTRNHRWNMEWLKSEKNKQTSSFKRIDQIQILHQSPYQNARKRLAEYSTTAPNNFHYKSPRMGGGSILAELRSRMKGTVVVNPMPKGNDYIGNRPELPFRGTKSDADVKVVDGKTVPNFPTTYLLGKFPMFSRSTLTSPKSQFALERPDSTAIAKLLNNQQKQFISEVGIPEALKEDKQCEEPNHEFISSTQILLEKTMPQTTQDTFNMEYEIGRMPTPPYLPFTVPAQEGKELPSRNPQPSFSSLFSSPEEATYEESLEQVDSLF